MPNLFLSGLAPFFARLGFLGLLTWNAEEEDRVQELEEEEEVEGESGREREALFMGIGGAKR